MQGSNGDLYGTAEFGGTYHNGSVFRITLAGKFTNLYSFCPQSGCLDGLAPSGWLALGSDGNLYGTTPPRRSQHERERLPHRVWHGLESQPGRQLHKPVQLLFTG